MSSEEEDGDLEYFDEFDVGADESGADHEQSNESDAIGGAGADSIEDEGFAGFVDDEADDDAEDNVEDVNSSEEENDHNQSNSDESESDEVEPFKLSSRIDPINNMCNKPRMIRVVLPDLRITDNKLHRSEVSQVISMRAQQIAKYATHFTNAEGMHDPVLIAYKELYDRRCPIILRRQIGTENDGNTIVVEEWDVKEMTLPTINLSH